jgi:hypothetical protein
MYMHYALKAAGHPIQEWGCGQQRMEPGNYNNDYRPSLAVQSNQDPL